MLTSAARGMSTIALRKKVVKPNVSPKPGRMLGCRQEELLQIYRRTVISAFSDVENALVAVAQTAERERRQREVVDASRRAFDLSETRLREGTIDLVTLVTIQQTLFQAEDLLVSQAILSQALPAAGAKKQLDDLVALVQRLGEVRFETRYTPQEFRFDVRWLYEKK